MKPVKKPRVKKDPYQICNLDCKKPKKKVKAGKKGDIVKGGSVVTKEKKVKKKGKDDIPEEIIKAAEKGDVYPQIHTFRGPVKVVVVDPPDDSTTECRVTAAAFIGVANLAIGANFVIFVVNSMGYVYTTPINVHMLTCAFGFQVLLPLSILIHHPLYGASAPLLDSERTCAHIKFLVLAIICVGAGIYLGYDFLKKPKSGLTKLAEEKLPFNSLHRTFGIIAGAVFVPALLSGVAVNVLNKGSTEPKSIVNIAHTVFGFATLLMANACFALSLFVPWFQTFMYYNSGLVPTILMILFVSFYTGIMIIIRGSSFND